MLRQRLRGRGSIVVSILIVSLFLFTVVTSLLILANSNLTRSKNRVLLLEAQYAAESGADTSIAQLNADATASYTGTGATEVQVMSNTLYKATFQTTVVNGASSNERVITSTGRVYRTNKPTVVLVSRTIEVTSQRTSGSISATGMMSRNIIDIQSGVKNIYAKDLFVNGYINMNKNTTNLIAENVVVAGKNTGAANCSIGGSGNETKPSTFTTSGQTKTKLTLAYNNCISPPGNSSNANFDVLTNQTNLPKVQSTYVPWSQFMDGSYTNSYNNCSDWTTGVSPRTIPSSGHTKQTHYPDSGSNISTSCGTSGDLALGSAQYNITDNVHIRGNLCAAAACSPTFNNPSGTPRYIFVEGSVNFDGVQTASGSGPLVLVVYGADPASKTSTCPLGGAIYLGSGGTTNAPDMYLLAVNGLCLDKTKFSAQPALGGLSGKNIYIATNPGSPWDLGLDTSFPTSAIPIDLSWHATHYRRR
jgi:hypothetical protein